MNKKILLLLPALALILGGCTTKKDNSSSQQPSSQTVAVESVEIDKTSATLDPGETLQLKAVAKPSTLADKSVKWSSNAAAVATVSSSGLVTAVNEGTAKIKAAANADETKFAECTITVNKRQIIVASKTADTEKTFKLGCYQENLEARYYFKGTVDSNTRGETSSSWADGVDVQLEESAGQYKVKILNDDPSKIKYFEMTDDHHFRVADTATILWDWNNEARTVSRTIDGTTYFPGTYNQYDTVSGCDIAQLAGDFPFQFLYKVEPCDPTEVNIVEASAEVRVGGNVQLHAEFEPAGAAEAQAVWSVLPGNDKVHVDQNGLVTADDDAVVGSNATIKATWGELEGATCVVTVIKAYNYNTEFDVTDMATYDVPATEGAATEIYLVGHISAITSTTYGNGTLVTPDGTEVTIYGMYNYNGKFRYDKMSTKPVVDDVVVLYGKTFMYNGAPEIKNGKLMQLEQTVCGPVAPTALALDPAAAFELEQGKSATVAAKLTPADAEATVSWTVTPAGAGVTYNEATGKVEATETATKQTYTLTASVADPALQASVQVTVVEPSGPAYESVGALSFNKNANVVITNELSDGSDPKITYAENGVTIVVRKGASSSDVNVWKSDYASCRWYVGHNVVISSSTAFKRVVLSCDSGNARFKDDATGVIANVSGGASVSYDGNDIILELSTPATSLTINPDKQIRPNNVELFRIAD